MMKKLSIVLCCVLFSVQAMAEIKVYNPSRMPQDALFVGNDTNGQRLYACLAQFRGSVQPGKTWQGYDKCNIAYAGREYPVREYRLVTGRFNWSNFTSRSNAPMGRDTDGKGLYLCKALYKNSWQPGKTWRGYHKCNISYAGKEIMVSNYKVLREPSTMGIHHGRSAHSQHGKHSERHRRQECLTDNFGRKQCGYHCVKTPFQVKCASRPGQNCIANVFNQIQCGYGCQVDRFNKIHCDQ